MEKIVNVQPCQSRRCIEQRIKMFKHIKNVEDELKEKDNRLHQLSKDVQSRDAERKGTVYHLEALIEIKDQKIKELQEKLTEAQLVPERKYKMENVFPNANFKTTSGVFTMTLRKRKPKPMPALPYSAPASKKPKRKPPQPKQLKGTVSGSGTQQPKIEVPELPLPPLGHGISTSIKALVEPSQILCKSQSDLKCDWKNDGATVKREVY